MLYSQIVLIGRGILNQASLHIGQRLRQYQAHATRVTMTHHVQGSQMLWSFVLQTLKVRKMLKGHVAMPMREDGRKQGRKVSSLTEDTVITRRGSMGRLLLLQ